MPLLAKARINSAPRRLRAGFVGALAAALVTSTSADAAGLIRDAETEALIREYAKPIFRAAGLGSQGIRIHLVNDRAFNAFVVDGHNMFMHAGTLMEAKTPNQVIGVIAHESGHITGGHLARLRNQVARAKSAALMLQLIGLAAMVGGAFAGAGDAGQAGMGIAYGGQDAMPCAPCSPTARTKNCQPIRPASRSSMPPSSLGGACSKPSNSWPASWSAYKASTPTCRPTRCRSSA